ncbi:MAG: hypothetical protein AAGE94_19695 [Acidobacteriota bacterium]
MSHVDLSAGGSRTTWFGDRPAWVAIEGFGDCVEWSAEPTVGDGAIFPRLDTRPIVEQSLVWRATSPFRCRLDEPLWAWFQPAGSAIHGYPDHPDELVHSAAVSAIPRDILTQRDGVAWLTVEVERVVPIDRIDTTFPTATGGDLFEHLATSRRPNVTTFGPWVALDASFEGSLGFQWIFRRSEAEEEKLVAYGEWGRDWEAIGVGNRPLDRSERRRLDEMMPQGDEP